VALVESMEKGKPLASSRRSSVVFEYFFSVSTSVKFSLVSVNPRRNACHDVFVLPSNRFMPRSEKLSQKIEPLLLLVPGELAPEMLLPSCDDTEPRPRAVFVFDLRAQALFQ
jgi:hypothetical protein